MTPRITEFVEDDSHWESTGENDVVKAIKVAPEPGERDVFRSVTLWRPKFARSAFGGHTLGQAVTASWQTVPANFTLHSAHAYWIGVVDIKEPIFYSVERINDGATFVTRLVKAHQRSGSSPSKVLFIITCSYHNESREKPQPAFKIPMPRINSERDGRSLPSTRPSTLAHGVLPPSKAINIEDLFLTALRQQRDKLPVKVRAEVRRWLGLRAGSSIEARAALPGMYDPRTGLMSGGHEQAWWYRSKRKIEGGLEAQKAAFAYASDFYLLSTVHKALALGADIGVRASLDHAIWFYDHFDISEWVLLVMQAQGAWNARGIAMARCYSQDGRLVAVVAQEGLVRCDPEGNTTSTL